MLNTAPQEWTIEQLVDCMKYGDSVQAQDGSWQPARGYGMYSLRSRMRLAWMVFTGKADALRWPLQNPKAY